MKKYVLMMISIVIIPFHILGLESKFNWTIKYNIDSEPSQIIEIVPRLEFKKGMNHTKYQRLPNMYGKWDCKYSLIQSNYENRKYIKENRSETQYFATGCWSKFARSFTIKTSF